MGRLIDADALIRKFKTASPMAIDGRARQMVEEMPTIEPIQKTGEWLEKEVVHFDDLVGVHFSTGCISLKGFSHEAKDIITGLQSARCSACGKYHTTPYLYYFDEYNFCPNCGADMRDDFSKHMNPPE